MRKEINKHANSFEESSDDDESEFLTDFDAAKTQASSYYNSGAAQHQLDEEEEKKSSNPSPMSSSYTSSPAFSSASSTTSLQKSQCIEILKQIISVKREQTFCQSKDKEIFITQDKLGRRDTLFSSSEISGSEAQSEQSDATSNSAFSQQDALTNEE